jgi:hypothetical protein
MRGHVIKHSGWDNAYDGTHAWDGGTYTYAHTYPNRRLAHSSPHRSHYPRIHQQNSFTTINPADSNISMNVGVANNLRTYIDILDDNRQGSAEVPAIKGRVRWINIADLSQTGIYDEPMPKPTLPPASLPLRTAKPQPGRLNYYI